MTKPQYWLSLAGLFFLTSPLALVTAAQAGDYPDKPVTIISDAAAGAWT